MIKAVIFDFDGVLADTFDKTLDICRELFSDLTVEQYKDHHNGNVWEEPFFEFSQSAVDYYNQEYLRRADAKRFFPLVKIIKDLEKDHKLFIVSSNTEVGIKKYLKLTGVDGCFEKVMGYQTEKSKVRKFRMIINDYRFQPSECVLVTDTLGDILEAKKVDMKCIAVTWGYHEKERLEVGKPDFIIDKFEELIPTIKKLK